MDKGAGIAEPTYGDITVSSSPSRRPPKAFHILLPVWGESFINRFLEESLPTLLAVGNIPALSRTLPTRFVLLTKELDEAAIRAHPACARLEQTCDVDFLPIDDLITSGNHSTTITLAWERAVRREGVGMLDICFVFLVSDYVMADGSLATIAKHMMAGASAIQAGNFQVNEVTAHAWLRERLVRSSGRPLSLTPREMVSWALGYLHPATVANTVNYPLCHNSHTNRLFWRVDRDTLIGRFYLMHQICIRPELGDFVIGSASDYSFVAEMCPSGNVVILSDSDEYFVAEIQPVNHEAQLIRYGPNSVDDLAKSLSEWTTARHRLNAQQTIIYHARELPDSLPTAIAEAEAFIAQVTPRLAPPQPHRDHPYWVGAMAAFNAAAEERQKIATGVRPRQAPGLMRRARAALVGKVPCVSRTHPRHRDYRALLAACDELIPPQSRLLIEASDETGLAAALRQKFPGATSFSFRQSPAERIAADIGEQQFDRAFVGLVNDDLSHVEMNLRRLVPALKPGGEIILVLLSVDGSVDLDQPGQAYAIRLTSLSPAGITVKGCLIGTMSRARWWVNDAAARAAGSLLSRSNKIAPLIWLRIAMSGLPALASNVIASYRPGNVVKPRQVLSSVLIHFVLESDPGRATAAGVSPKRIGARILTNDVGFYANLLAGLSKWKERVRAGHPVSFCASTNTEVFTAKGDDQGLGSMRRSEAVGEIPVRVHTPIQDGENWFREVNRFMAAREVENSAVIIMLGADRGTAAVRSYRMLQLLNPLPCKLVLVDPKPENLAHARRHLLENGLDPADHWLVPLALGAGNTPVHLRSGAQGNQGESTISADIGALVSAISLQELLGPFEQVDYLDAHLRQPEIEVFAPFIDLLRRKVRRIHIGAHDNDSHQALLNLFAQNGWDIVFSFEPNAHFETPLGDFDTNDGVLTVVNPDL